jgi:hypothetical protein
MSDFSFLDDQDDKGAVRINVGQSRRRAVQQPKKKSDRSAAAGCLAFLLFVGGCVYVVQNGHFAPAKVDPGDDHRSLAIVNAQSHVKSLLKAPRSAKWPGVFDVADLRNHATKMKDGTYIVRSFVDAQNSFGAMIRTWYVVRLRLRDNGTADVLEAQLLDDG